MLYEFIEVNRDEIIGRCRAKVACLPLTCRGCQWLPLRPCSVQY